MTLLLQIIGGLLALLGSWLVFRALLEMDEREPEGRVTEGCRIRHLPRPEDEGPTSRRWWR